MTSTKKKRTGRTKVTTVKPLIPAAREKYVLRLFVAGATTRSSQAVVRVRELCETTLKNRVELEVIDIYQQPGLAREDQIVATPTLIFQLPLPVRRFIGNLTNLTDLLCLMDLGEDGRTILPLKIAEDI